MKIPLRIHLEGSGEARHLRTCIDAREILELLMDHLQSTMQAQNVSHLQLLAGRLEGAPEEVLNSARARLAFAKPKSLVRTAG